LPPDLEVKSNKKNKYLYWVTIRKAVQYLFLLLFLLYFVKLQSTGSVGREINPFIHSNPLLMLVNTITQKEFLTAFSLSLIIILFSFLFGRVWCGWFCPLGTILDLFSLKRGNNKQLTHTKLKYIKYMLLFTILFTAIWGIQTLLIFDPVTLLIRSLTFSIWPLMDKTITSLEKFLYPFDFLGKYIAEFDSAIRPSIFPTFPTFYRWSLGFGVIFLAILLSNLYAPRFWCRYICPLGGLLAIFSKFAIFRRDVNSQCINCGICNERCPTAAIDSSKGYSSNPAECTLCMDCFKACPVNSIELKTINKSKFLMDINPSRRQALSILGTSAAAYLLLKLGILDRQEKSLPIRPPGSTEKVLLNSCLRCGECLRICPTTALQPALFEHGLESLWTPILIPRTGYCDYSCNACGDICPVDAIPKLDLNTKKTTVIGTAIIDPNLCIAWADQIDCIVCEEMCPLPDKAIKLHTRRVKSNNNSTRQIKLPYVIPEICIGCGICENKCPVVGQAAIRVYPETN